MNQIQSFYSRKNIKKFLQGHCIFGEESVYILLAVNRRKLRQPNDKFEHMSVSKVIRRLDNIDLVLDEIEAIMADRCYYMYVSVNPRSVVKAGIELSKSILDFIYHQHYEPLKKLNQRFISHLMKESCRVAKGHFLLDVDTHELSVIQTLNKHFQIVNGRKTLNGYHLIVERFDTRKMGLLDLQGKVELKRDDLVFLNAHYLKEEA